MVELIVTTIYVEGKMDNKGSEWRRWDLHLHTSSSYDYEYNADNADEILVQALLDNEIEAVKF